MRLRRLLCVLVFSCLSLLTVFSGASIKACAITVPSGGHYLSASETRQYIGDSFDVTYWNGSDYVTVQASYDSAITPNFTENSTSPVGFVSGSGVVWLRYYCYLTNINTSPQYLTVKLHPTYSIFDTEYLYSCLALSTSSMVSSATYDSPQSNWFIGGSIQNFQNTLDSTSTSGYQAYLHTFNTSYNHRQFTYVPIVHSSNSAFSCYCLDSSFNGNVRLSGTWSYAFLVMCPYVSGDATGASGTFVPDSGSGGSDVDLTETNGLLESIVSGISGIGDSIKGLFVPDEEDLVDFKEDVADILTDSFSGYSETQDMLDDVRDVLISSNPSAVLEFPALNIPGTHFATPAKSINLNFDNTTIEWVKWIIDIMATIAVVNMIQNKIKAVLVGESVVEVEEIDG